jgi:hypothetical protein
MRFISVVLFALMTTFAYASSGGEGNNNNCNGQGNPNSPCEGGGGAGGNGNPGNGGNGGAGGDGTAVAEAHAGAVATANGGDVTVNVDGLAGGGIDAGDVNTGDVNVEGDSVSYANSYSYREVKQAPTVIPGSGNNTAGCVKVIGLGGSYADGNAGGFSLGFPKTDKDCSLDRAARMAFEMGNAHAGWRLYCAQDAVMSGYKLTLSDDVKGKKARKVAAYDECLKETLSVSVDLQATLINATQIIHLDDDLRERVETLESAAHRPDSKTLLINE